MKKKKKKKKSRWWLIPVIIFLVLSVYSLVIYWMQQQQEEKATFAVYPGFGIEIPLGYPLHGIDVSYYQQYIYWPAVKKMQVNDVRIGFAFIKATEGLSSIDKQFKKNWQQAKVAGIPRGAYHFFLATKDGKAQANNFIKNVQLQSGDLPPVLDIEQLYNVQPVLMRKRIKDWLMAVEAAYKVKPIIYSSTDFYQRYLGDAFNEYPFWVAHYFRDNDPRIKRDWLIWQHSNVGKVNGINGSVDFNVFNGDSLQFRQILVR